MAGRGGGKEGRISNVGCGEKKGRTEHIDLERKAIISKDGYQNIKKTNL